MSFNGATGGDDVKGIVKPSESGGNCGWFFWVAALWSCAFCAADTAAVVVEISIWGGSDVAFPISVSAEFWSRKRVRRSGPSPTDGGASMPIVSVIL